MSELGRGSMGTVFLARDRVLDREVAVKLLAASLLDDGGRARFMREARAAARLRHPNVVAIHDAVAQHDAAFLVMERVEGRNLREAGPFALEQSVEIGRQLCLALAHAHGEGVVHRDVKPENVLVRRGADGLHAKLADFGLASAQGASRLTAQGMIMGTLAYLAPEQALAGEVDGRADLYALGVLLYELVLGRTPFVSDRPQVLLSQHIKAPPPPPRSIDPRVPPALEAILLRLLAKQPQQRFATADALRAALERVAEGELPPLRVTGRAEVVGAPPHHSELVGRASDLERGRALLLAEHVRLLTLTGPGGTGKTRLAARLAAHVSSEFPAGAFFVELAAIADAALVPVAVARVVGATPAAGVSTERAIAERLGDGRALLVLDNLEQVLAAVPFIESLLAACPKLTMMVTSRVRLRSASERELPVEPLGLPEPGASGTVADVAAAPAVQLFVRRARAQADAFAVTDANAEAIARICRRLDGLPLAIELAAARARLLSPEAMAEQLDRLGGSGALELVAGGTQERPERHRTQRAAIAWSYALLDPAAQALFRRLGVFAGFVSLDAARAVHAGDGAAAPNVLDGLAALADHSLIVARPAAGEAGRFTMLETIREFARERLEGEGEASEAARRHFEHFHSWVKQQAAGLKGPSQSAILAALDDELPNLRVAWRWALRHGAPGEALRLAVAMRWFWLMRGHSTEGRQWLATGLSADGIEDALRAEALHVLGNLAQNEGDLDEATQRFEDSRDRYARLGDRVGFAHNLGNLGLVARERGDYAGAESLLQQGLTVWRELGRTSNVADSLLNLSLVALGLGEHARAATHAEESLRMMRQLGNRHHAAACLDVLGCVAMERGELGDAESLMEESLAVRRDLDDAHCSSHSLMHLSQLRLRRDDRTQAAAMLRESIVLLQKAGVRHDIADALDGLAGVAIAEGRLESAARLLGAAEAIRETSGTALAPHERRTRERTVSDLRERMGETTFRGERITGRAASLETTLSRDAGAQ